MHAVATLAMLLLVLRRVEIHRVVSCSVGALLLGAIILVPVMASAHNDLVLLGNGAWIQSQGVDNCSRRTFLSLSEADHKAVRSFVGCC